MRHFILGALFSLALSPASAATIRVALDGTGDFPDLASAVAAALDGDTVLVEPGEYALASPLDFSGKAIAVQSASGPEVTKLILSGDPLRASLAVFENGEGSSSVLEGFTLSGGRGTGRCAPCPRRGGAIWCVGASPTLRNLRLDGNRAAAGGALFIAEGANPLIEDCIISENEAEVGGGVYIDTFSAPIFRRVSISKNQANTGGGVYLGEGTAALFESCAIYQNEADEGGGLAMDGAAPRLAASSVLGNAAKLGAGLLVQYRSAVTLEGCRLSGNRAESWGGGIFSDHSAVSIANTTVTYNSIYCESTRLILNHVTIRDGSVEMISPDPTSSVSSSIIWRGGFGWGSGASEQVNLWERVSYSCIQGLPADQPQGPGNLDADPLFCWGWNAAEIHVDASAPGLGAGTAEDPYPDLAYAFAYGRPPALSPGSPCLGKGEGGSNMGADLGTCASVGGQVALRLGPGTYPTGNLPFEEVASLEGSGWEQTVLTGAVQLLHAGAKLSGVTVTGSASDGVTGSDLEIRDARIVRNAAHGVRIFGNSTFSNCLISHNLNSGVAAESDSMVKLDRCTVAFNEAFGVDLSAGGSANVKSSILWGNGAAAFSSTGSALAAYSCIQGGRGGTGNINLDPRFCGWPSPEVQVDAAALPSGDGSSERPFQDLAAALDVKWFQYSLQSDSPCLGKGEGGTDMGAGAWTCESAQAFPRRLVRMAPGSYSLEGANTRGADLAGSGRSSTFLSGSVVLQGDTSLADLTISESLDAMGISIVLSGVTVRGETICEPQGALELKECLLRGLRALDEASLVLEHSTVAGASEYGLSLAAWARATVTSSIIWRNGGGISLGYRAMAVVRYSCVQGPAPWPGEGNLNADPRFCGWSVGAPVEVRSQADLDLLLASEDYNYSLAADSPCLSGGAGSTRMGADLGVCSSSTARIVQLAPGSYVVQAKFLSDLVFSGADPSGTVLDFSGNSLINCQIANLTVAGSLNLSGGDNRFDDCLLLNTVGFNSGSSGTLARCTIAGSSGYGLVVQDHSRAEVSDSIIWRNQAGGIQLEGGGTVVVRTSCVQGPAPWPGEGNLNLDPRFCGWKGPSEALATNDAELAVALAVRKYDYRLRSDSPCLGAGLGGGDMGAQLGTCEATAWPYTRLVRVAPGRFTIGSLSIAEGIRVTGASRGDTVLHGEGLQLFSRTALEDLTLEFSSGVTTAGDSSVDLRAVSVHGSGAPGLLFGQGVEARLADCGIWGNSGPALLGLERSRIEADRSTLAANGGAGLELRDGASCTLTSSIVWGNVAGAVSLAPGAVLEASYSALETETPWPGPGNLDLDPQLCGWKTVLVALTSLEELNSINEPLGLGLASTSPCIGSGLGGADMGAPGARCDAPGGLFRTFTLGPGTYPPSQLPAVLPVPSEIRGAGKALTRMDGNVGQLPSGVTLRDVTVRGGVTCNGPASSPRFLDCSISENGGPGVTCTGGAKPTFERCRIEKNLGGGFHSDQSSPMLTNCLIVQNSGYGFETYGNLPAGSFGPSLVNCTIVGNDLRGEGVIIGTTGATVKNCIIWDKLSLESDTSRATVTYSLIKGYPLWPGPGNTNFPPLFVSRGRWLGLGSPNPQDDLYIPDFRDLRLRPYSPAIDAGTAEGAPADDFDGNPRPCWGGIDIGAYEYCGAEPPLPPPPIFRRGDANNDESVDISDAIRVLVFLFLGGVEISCLGAADIDDGGAVDISDPIYLLYYLFIKPPPPPAPFPHCDVDPTADNLPCPIPSACW